MYCIYRITNLINGKTYIGQHRYKKIPYDDYIGSGVLLHKAYKKYGVENFKKEIICKNVQYKETIDDMEKFYIKKERNNNPNGCYNIADGGEGGCGPLSEKTKRKLSEAHKGRTSGAKGKHHSEETRRKLAAAHKGMKISEDHKRKLHEAWKGSHHSEETRKHLSEINKGKHHSEETKNKLSKLYKGKHWKLVDGKRVWY